MNTPEPGRAAAATQESLGRIERRLAIHEDILLRILRILEAQGALAERMQEDVIKLSPLPALLEEIRDVLRAVGADDGDGDGAD